MIYLSELVTSGSEIKIKYIFFLKILYTKINICKAYENELTFLRLLKKMNFKFVIRICLYYGPTVFLKFEY